MNTTIKALLITLGGIAFITLLVITNCDCECHIKTKRIKDDYNGYVIKTYCDTTNHGTPLVVLKDSSKHILYSTALDSFLPGDYVLKRAGDIQYRRIRNRDTTVFNPTCNGIEIRK